MKKPFGSNITQPTIDEKRIIYQNLQYGSLETELGFHSRFVSQFQSIYEKIFDCFAIIILPHLVRHSSYHFKVLF